MNPRIYAPVLVSALLSVNALANVLEEVIVTSSLIDQTSVSYTHLRAHET